MRRLECYETRDGILHRSYADAKRHAEKLYGEQLSKMAHDLVRIDKYSDMCDKLDGYKGSMAQLLKLSADLSVAPVDDEEYEP